MTTTDLIQRYLDGLTSASEEQLLLQRLQREPQQPAATDLDPSLVSSIVAMLTLTFPCDDAAAILHEDNSAAYAHLLHHHQHVAHPTTATPRVRLLRRLTTLRRPIAATLAIAAIVAIAFVVYPSKDNGQRVLAATEVAATTEASTTRVSGVNVQSVEPQLTVTKPAPKQRHKPKAVAKDAATGSPDNDNVSPPTSTPAATEPSPAILLLEQEAIAAVTAAEAAALEQAEQAHTAALAAITTLADAS